MAWENKLSPLFGHMEATSSEPAPSQSPAQPLPVKTESILGTLSEAKPAPVPSVSVIAPEASEGKTDTIDSPLTSPVQTVTSPSSVPLVAPLETAQTLSSTVPDTVPVQPPVFESVPAIPEPSLETIKPEAGSWSPPNEAPRVAALDTRLAQYLQSDHVYQSMLKSDDQSRIRLQLALRYTLLMFAIFLVFAWIVSNRVIMFGFSEFIWLARIRDILFAVMAGLFSLTVWFWSPVWMHRPLPVTILRSLAAVFFGAVLVGLYIPF